MALHFLYYLITNIFQASVLCIKRKDFITITSKKKKYSEGKNVSFQYVMEKGVNKNIYS